MSDKPAKQNYISQAWLVIVLALLYGAALAAVQLGWSGRIEENKRNKIYSQIPALVGVAEIEVEELNVTGANGKESIVYRVSDEQGQPLGWVLRGSGQGFADAIELLVSMDPQMTTITGLFVLSQKETPGLGDYITSHERFTGNFAGKRPPLTVVKEVADGPNQIQALTGATVSSESVATIANRVIDNVKKPLLAGEFTSMTSSAAEEE